MIKEIKELQPRLEDQLSHICCSFAILKQILLFVQLIPKPLLLLFGLSAKIRLRSENMGIFFAEIKWGVLFLLGIKKINTTAGFTKYKGPHLVYMHYSLTLADFTFCCVLIYAVFRQ